MAEQVGLQTVQTKVFVEEQGVDVDDLKFDGKTEGEKVVFEKAAKSMIEQSAQQTHKTQQIHRSLAERSATGAGAAALAKLLAQFKKVIPDLPPHEQFAKFLKDLKKDGGTAEEIKKYVG